MPAPELLAQAKALADEAVGHAEEYTTFLAPVQDYIVKTFGENGLIATYIALAVLVLFAITRAAKLTFSAVKYLVIPALALSFLATLFLPITFAAALPVSVTVCSLFLLFKG